MTGSADRTLLRFIVVGGSLAVVYAILAALATSQLPLPKALSAALVWVLCIPLGYWSHRRFSFGSRSARRHGLWLYGGTQVLSVLIASATSFLLATGEFQSDLLVHLLASALAALASYALNSRFTFPAR